MHFHALGVPGQGVRPRRVNALLRNAPARTRPATRNLRCGRARSSVRCVMATAALLAAFGAEAERFSVDVYRDLPWTDARYADGKHFLDVYAPADADGAPVLMFLHGGGLLQGDKSLNAHIGVRFARAGFVVVSPNYRLSPGVNHPAHIRDVADAFAWVRAHARRFGGDTNAIVLAGHSAGAYLAALLATEPRWLAAHQESPAAIAGLVAISGFYHVERVAPNRPKSVWGADPAGWRRASPVRHVDADAPPTLLLFADGDTETRRQESRDFAQALREAGADPVSVREINNRDHVSIWRYLNARGDAAAAAIETFVRKVTAPAQGR